MIQTPYPNAKILLVDDQDANLRLLERILRQGGYSCSRSLSDSRQTLSVCREFSPDLILLDLMMPHLDGVAVIKQLEPLTQGTYLPILILTADVAAESKWRALAAGAKDFLTKPLDAVDVLLRIKNHLETRSVYQQLQQWADRRIQEQADLLDQANDAILVTNPDDRIRYWNRGAERLYGWTAEEVLGEDAGSLLGGRPMPDQEEAKQKMAADGNWTGELRQVTREGRHIVVASRWTQVRDEEGTAKGQLIINTDITAKKELEVQLAQAQRLEAIGVLAGGVAHDFNNLLTIIIGYSEMALGGLSTEAPTHGLVQEIRKAGQCAATLTRQLLAFSRRQVLAPVVLDLNALVQETEKMLGRLIGEDILLSTQLDPDLKRVKADPGQIEQVLMNLVVNARDAMPTGGQLTISTRNAEVDGTLGRRSGDRQRGPHVALMVRDTGCGMDEATQARIFEPFFTTKALGKGTGLGLATVYGIVKQSGGFIEVTSQRGQGATFELYLPALMSEAAPERPSQAGQLLLPHGTGTLLLVEDEDRLRSLESYVLRSAGYTVLEARDGEEALQVCEHHLGELDLLVTDVVMPKMSGRQLAEKVAVLRPGLRILYMSGYTDDTMVRHGVSEATLAFLQKPFTPSVLVRKIHEMLGQ
ncbi:MAG TPA: response regulator [Gemmataceae bacterium]|nr:response regulator [Gemmataceae bacterium]